MTEARVVMVTVPDGNTGEQLVRTLLEERLVACGNLIAGVRSIYRWKGEVCQDPEVIVILKTTASALSRLTERVVALHPYDCPEVLAIPVEGGFSAYLAWITENVSSAVPAE